MSYTSSLRPHPQLQERQFLNANNDKAATL